MTIEQIEALFHLEEAVKEALQSSTSQDVIGMVHLIIERDKTASGDIFEPYKVRELGEVVEYEKKAHSLVMDSIKNITEIK